MKFPDVWKQAFMAALSGLSSGTCASNRSVAANAADIADHAVEEYDRRLDANAGSPDDLPRFKSEADTDYTNLGGGR
jgi:hypothetical protein